MRFLLVSIFVISLMIILTPNAFGVQYPVLIPNGVADNRGMNFSPSEIEIEKGDTIKWKNLELNTVHTVTSTSGLFDERLIQWQCPEIGECSSQQKATFSYTFEEIGTYNYKCKMHSWMKGVVKVIELGQDAEIKIHDDAGDMYIDKSQYEVIEDGSVKIKIYGEVKNLGAGTSILFTITKPDGSTSELKTYRTGEGYYQLILSINYEDRGTYNVVSTFGLENIGTANFVVVERPNPTIENPFPTSDDESTNVIGSSQNNQENALTITTDFPSYKKGDMIWISGITPYLGQLDPNNTSQLIIQILDPRNNIITVSQLSPNDDRTYSVSINGDGPMWKFEGDYTVKANFANEKAATTFFFSLAGAPPEQVYGSIAYTTLKLDSLDNTFNAQGPDSRSSMTFSGQLLEEGPVNLGFNYGISGATITLEFTGFTMDGNNYHKITTDNNGRFDFGVTMPVGEGYAVQAVFDGLDEHDRWNDGNYLALLSSRSQIEYFDVRSAPFQPQPPTTPEDDIAVWNGILGLVVLIIVIVAIVIGIKGARKKKPIQYQTIGGSRQPPAPPKPKRSFRIRKPKPKVQPQGIEDYDLGPLLYCPNVACRSEHLQTKANGQKYCTKCGWNK